METKIFNATTGQEILREMNAEELTAYQSSQNEIAIESQAKATKAIDKAALLAKLGISEAEAQLLLGGN